jgi:hypothetical protein
VREGGREGRRKDSWSRAAHPRRFEETGRKGGREGKRSTGKAKQEEGKGEGDRERREGGREGGREVGSEGYLFPGCCRRSLCHGGFFELTFSRLLNFLRVVFFLVVGVAKEGEAGLPT